MFNPFCCNTLIRNWNIYKKKKQISPDVKKCSMSKATRSERKKKISKEHEHFSFDSKKWRIEESNNK